jgi:very-short-patch-repair endonuclease
MEVNYVLEKNESLYKYTSHWFKESTLLQNHGWSKLRFKIDSVEVNRQTTMIGLAYQHQFYIQ